LEFFLGQLLDRVARPERLERLLLREDFGFEFVAFHKSEKSKGHVEGDAERENHHAKGPNLNGINSHNVTL